MTERVDKLGRKFSEYLGIFDKESIFTGPSLYFHYRTLERLNSTTPVRVFEDKQFFEYLYATLCSWGLHRMGPTPTKLVEFENLCSSLQAQKDKIIDLQEYRLSGLSDEESNKVRDALWEILSNLEISKSETQLVAGSKALHHLLPAIMPPIDRQYTLMFFYNSKNPYDTGRQVFKTIYPLFHRIAVNNRDAIRDKIGQGFHTSETKVIDNAIVGFVLKELK